VAWFTKQEEKPGAGGLLGREAEDLACRHLRDGGMAVVARNYRAGRVELDIVCTDGDAVVFVEVKARSSSGFGGAPAAISATKRGRVGRAARHYLTEKGLYGEVPCRFDVVLVDAGQRPYRITHIPNAFAVEET